MTRWQRYWFADGGRYAAAVVRIAIATAVLLSLWRLWHQDPLVAPAGLYRPIGPWMLLGHHVPPAALVSALWVVAWAGSACMLVGLHTRAATAASFVASVALAAVSFSMKDAWSHQYNVVFLAQCAFLGARGGDVWSIDALRGKGADVPGGYQWSLRLVQLAVALMFTGAVFHKLLHGHFTLRWALTDNLRHHLLVTYDLAGLPRTAVADWIIDDVWKYRTAALLNMCTQLVPIFACVFVRRPLVRLACGAAFITETLALGLVIDLWNLHWLPLVAVFVDWDWLLRRAPPPASDRPRPRRAIRIFIVGFVAYEVVTSFIPTVDQRLNTFPFSSFPMFASIRATAPYDEHHDYVVPGDHIDALPDPTHVFAQRWLDHAFRGLYKERDPGKLEHRLQAIVAQAPARYPDATITGVRAWVTLYVAPAYPAPAHFEMHPIAIAGELSPDGTFRTLLGGPHGLDPSGARYVYYTADDAQPRDAPGPDTVYTVAIIAGTPWLVSSQPGY